MSEPSEMEKEDEPEIQEVDETEEVAVDEGTAPKSVIIAHMQLLTYRY